MKFSCTTAELLQALQLASRAISGQQALPILQNVLLHAEGKRCTLSATDLELSIVTHIDASIENEGAITVPAKALLNFAQYTQDSEVVLETVEGTQLRCTSKRSKTLLAGESSTEYPTISSVERKKAFTLDGDALLTALHLVTFACARTTLRPVLSGVSVRSEKGHLILVATDSYRLSEYRIPVEGIDSDVQCIIPVKVLEELRSVLSSRRMARKTEKPDDDEKREQKALQVSVTLSAQQVEFSVGSTHLISRLIDGKFPDYKQIIPQQPALESSVETRELSATIKRMHYFAKEVNNSLSFHFSPQDVRITTPATQLGRDEATLPAEVKGTDAKIALSSSYLLDFLGHIDDGTVTLKITDSMHPALFALPHHPLFLHLIMPLRMQEEKA